MKNLQLQDTLSVAGIVPNTLCIQLQQIDSKFLLFPPIIKLSLFLHGLRYGSFCQGFTQQEQYCEELYETFHILNC